MNNKGQQVREKILEYIVSYIQDHGYPPTRREIGEAVGLKSPSSVQSHIRRMIGGGHLRRTMRTVPGRSGCRDGDL